MDNLSMQAIGLKKRADGNLLDAHKQWRSRPKDEAVFTVDELVRRTGAMRAASQEIDSVSWSSLKVLAHGDQLLLTRGNGGAAAFNNFSLQQFCGLQTKAGTLAPSGFITDLSPKLAADVLNERLAKQVARKSDASLLVASIDGSRILRRVSTEKYEQVFDHTLALRVQELCARGGWGPAEAFKRAGTGERARHAKGEQPALPLGWVGDRNMFVLLVDYSRSITVEGSTYARFFMLSHSEVCAGALNITFGLLDFVCCNLILWGCTQVFEASFRHTKSIQERWTALSSGLTKSLAAENEATIADGISAARAYLLGDKKDEAIAVAIAATDLPKGLVIDAYDRAAATPRYGDPRSAWGMLNGLTEASQHAAEHADKRAAIDAKAARLMGLLNR